MPNLSALFIHPIKSCAGRPMQIIRVNKRGPEGDREFLITTPGGVFLTQREFPGMALIQARKSADSAGWMLRLEAPGVRPYLARQGDAENSIQGAVVWDDLCNVYDQGDGVAEWLHDFLGAYCRLFRMTAEFTRHVDPRYSPEGGEVAFSDGYPFLLISDASLDDLNQRLEQAGKPPVSREHFRSVLWVSGCEPFAEDSWKRIRIGPVIFDVVKPCARCVITTINPATGVARNDNEPLVTLANKYRTQELRGKKGVMFGQNLVHRGLGTLQVGDEIEILESK